MQTIAENSERADPRVVLEHLYPVLRQWLRLRMTVPHHEDVLHDFIEKMLVTWNSGVFSQLPDFPVAYVFVALRNHVCDHRRREQRARKHTESLHRLRFRREHREDGSSVCDQIWAANVIRKSLDRLRHERSQSQQGYRYRLLEARVLTPVLTGTAAPSYAELARQFRLPSAQTAESLIVTERRRLRQLLLETAADTSGQRAEDALIVFREIVAETRGSILDMLRNGL